MKASFYLLAVAILGTAVYGSLSLLDVEDEGAVKFLSWAQEHGKEYHSLDEVNHRMSVFLANLEKIEAHNALNKSWTMGMNAFGDLTWEEFKATRLSKALKFQVLNRSPQKHYFGQAVPMHVDWTKKFRKVNPIQDQGQCGSCWAFSAVSSMESAIAIKHHHLVKLSEQQLVDCSDDYGCDGGLVDDAFSYAMQTGMCREKAYPYTAEDGTCTTCKGKTYKISSFVDVEENSVNDLMAAVAQQPVSIAIEADQDGFQFYKSGIFDGECGDELDHAVVVVGYGREFMGKKYWKVRNSWGATWGEQGYIRMIRGSDDNDGSGICGILSTPSYPVV